jgi:hypothetical protein
MAAQRRSKPANRIGVGVINSHQSTAAGAIAAGFMSRLRQSGY